MISNTCENHLIQAQKNEGLVLFFKEECDKKPFFEWIFVGIYYTALHYFHAFLDYKGVKKPESHKSKNDFDKGDIDLADDIFYTTNKDGSTFALSGTYSQLYNWSCDVRYNPSRISLLGKKELGEAIDMLDEVKYAVFNEIGHKAKRDGKKYKVKKVSQEHLDGLYEKISARYKK